MMTEFGLIEMIRTRCGELPTNSFEGIGDDCAVLRIGGGEALVYTSDLLVEQVHFLRRATTPEELAHKALHVNLSDVASMGVRPVATLLSVALPPEMMAEDWAERFAGGYVEASKRAGVALIGGDTTASERDIVINVTAIGRGPEANLKRRKDALAGDIICVSGELGGSGAGLKDILAGRYDTPQARLHKCPTAQIEEGIWLGRQRAVHAMMDLSDGPASDLRHILKASGVGAEVELEAVPIAPGADLDLALAGGEEYKLLLTVAAEEFEALAAAYRQHFGTPLYPIGRITPAPAEGEALRWLRCGSPTEEDWQGFRHY